MSRKMEGKIRRLLRRPRRGSEVLEAALVFPILLALAFGTVEFGYYFYVEHNLESAAREGARAAIPAGLNAAQRADEVEAAVDRVMTASGYQPSDYEIDVTDPFDTYYIQVKVKMHWSNVNEGLKPMRMIQPKNDLVEGVATMRLEQ
jgi:Flp pilus assembly protein TadG